MMRFAPHALLLRKSMRPSGVRQFWGEAPSREGRGEEEGGRRTRRAKRKGGGGGGILPLYPLLFLPFPILSLLPVLLPIGVARFNRWRLPFLTAPSQVYRVPRGPGSEKANAHMLALLARMCGNAKPHFDISWSGACDLLHFIAC